jgi:hypothetical protein
MRRIVRVSQLFAAVALLTTLQPLAIAQNRPPTSGWVPSWSSTSTSYCSARGYADCSRTCPGQFDFTGNGSGCACSCLMDSY